MSDHFLRVAAITIAVDPAAADLAVPPLLESTIELLRCKLL